MLAKDIRKGGIYVIRHHDGQFCTVRVEVVTTTPPNSLRPGRTQYLCTKLETGNTIRVKSAAKFRREVNARVEEKAL